MGVLPIKIAAKPKRSHSRNSVVTQSKDAIELSERESKSWLLGGLRKVLLGDLEVTDSEDVL
jgi:hypothetical protein